MMHALPAAWELPNEGNIKINVASFWSDAPLENGNRSGIEVVFWNDRGTIIRMVAGSLGIDDERLNEFYAMHYGLRRAYFERHIRIELDVPFDEAYWQWRNARENGTLLEHNYIIGQLEKRRRAKSQSLQIQLIENEQNRLAMYLSSHGAHRWDRMVVLVGPFGRVRELWHNDLGLGPVGPQYIDFYEGDLMDDVMDEDVVADGVVLEISEE